MAIVPTNLKGIVENRAAVADMLSSPGDLALVQRGIPRWLLIRCPCGCGEDIPINLDTRAGKAWRLYQDGKTGMSLFPSVWRDTGCESHFILRRNQIYLFGKFVEDYAAPFGKAELNALAQRMLTRWPAEGFVRFPDAADALGEMPWDVLDACQLLVKKGELFEGSGQLKGAFRRAK